MALIRTTPSSNALLYLSTHLSQMEVFRYSNHISPKTLVQKNLLAPIDELSFLQRQISKQRKNFATQHKLGKMSIIKTWGLASFDQYVAVCITLHPSDQVEYRIPKEEQSIIIFSSASLENHSYKGMSVGPDIFFPWEAEKEVKSVLDAYEPVVKKILNWANKDFHEADCLSRRMLYNCYFAALIMLSTERKADSVLEWKREILHKIRRQEASLFEDRLDDEVISNLPGDAHDLPDTLKDLNDYIRSQSIREVTWPKTRRFTESCCAPGCRAPLVWEKLTAARCLVGHQWRALLPSHPIFYLPLTVIERCTLTFMAIQEPGISKYCETCGREYLNEKYLWPIPPGVCTSETSRENSGLPNLLPGLASEETSHLRELIRTFDKCIFCGGKFIS